MKRHNSVKTKEIRDCVRNNNETANLHTKDRETCRHLTIVLWFEEDRRRADQFPSLVEAAAGIKLL